MSLRNIAEFIQFLWLLETQHHQRLAWEDAAQARIARDRAEAQAAEQLRAMLDANPSGSLGDAKIDDIDALEKSGLL